MALEIVGFTLGVLATVEQVITTAESLKCRYESYKQNPRHITHLLTSYQSFAGDLHAMDDQFRGKLCDLAPANKRIFERHIVEMVESFDFARNTLDEVSAKLARGRVMRFLRAKAQGEVCDELLTELRRVEGLLFDINSFLATADIIDSVKDEIRAGGDGDVDEFRPSFPVITASPDLVLDFDSVDSDGNPNTAEAKVKRMLLTHDDDSGVVALQGMGGVGKSSVLRQLSIDFDIRQHYSDGIYLVTLGVDANLGTAIRELLNAILESGGNVTVKRLQGETALNAVTREVVRWFQARTCLFLIDDLWSTNGLGAYFLSQLVGIVGTNRRSRVVVTTREVEIASQGHLITLKPLESLSERSRAIVLRYAKSKEEEVDDDQTKGNIEELLRMSGGLPVSLAIIGKGVYVLSVSYGGRKKIAWDKYLRTLRTCKDDLMRRDMDGYTNLAATFSASLALLEERRHTLPVPTSMSFAQMHQSLCILRKQGSAPLSMLRLLWKMQNDHHAAFIAREFARIGLAQVVLDRINDDYHEFLRLHDIIHDFSVSRAKPHPSAIHDELLNAYSASAELPGPSQNNCTEWWLPSLKPDRYIHVNLCRHLRQASRENELFMLLCRPEWAKRQLDKCNIGQIEDDFLEGILGLTSLNAQSTWVTEKEFKDIAGAIRLSSTFLSQNPSELGFQLYSRLVAKAASSTVIEDYLKRIEDNAEMPWVQPMGEYLAISGGPLQTIINAGNPLASLCLSSDGKQAFCGSDNGSLFVISLEGSGEILSRWKAHNDVVCGVSLASHGSMLVTGSWDCTVKVWDLTTKTCVASCSLHQGGINAVCTAPDEGTVLSASQDDTVKVWKISTPDKEIVSFKKHYGSVFCVATSPDGRCAFSGSDDGVVQMWSMDENGDVRKRFSGHTRWVRCLAVSADGKLLATGAGPTIRLWDVDATEQHPKCLEAPNASVRSLSTSPDGSRLASGYDDNSIRLWDVKRGELIGNKLTSHSDTVMGVELSPDGSKLVSCSWDGSIRVWDLLDSSQWEAFRPSHDAGVTCLALSSDGSQLVSGSKDRSVKVWDVSSGKLTPETYMQLFDDDVSGVAISSNGRRIVTTSLDKTLRVLDRETRTEIAKMTGHERNIRCMAVSADGNRAFTGSYDLTIRIWDLAKEDGSHEILSGHTNWIRRLFLSEDGKRIISASWLEVRVWDIECRECIRFVDLEDAHMLSQEDLFAAAGESWERSAHVDVPLGGRQIVWKRDGERRVLGTLEADVTCWCLSESLSTICVGLSSGQVAFFKLHQ